VVRLGAGDAQAVWPNWTPPPEMLQRQPGIPRFMSGGPDNPLGPRALYLFRDGRDLLYRIHGTTEPWTIGTDVSSGCIRLLNEDLIDLYDRAPTGTKVLVMKHLV
jgi:lipoprotein-anchoring transpeptidase ErfK/SrfK